MAAVNDVYLLVAITSDTDINLL